MDGSNALGAAELAAMDGLLRAGARNPFRPFSYDEVPVVVPPDVPAVMAYQFSVDGLPAPKGSKSYKGRRRNGSAILVESAAEALGPWAERVERAARASGTTFHGPVEVSVVFRFPRPARPKYEVPAVKPDGDKLDRAVWDSLKAGGMIEDDARVVRWRGEKRYALPGEAPGAHVTVREYRP